MRRWIWMAALVLVGFDVAAHGKGVTLDDVRLREGGALTRVVLEFDRAPEYKKFKLSKPWRLVFDIQDATVSPTVRATHKGTGIVNKVRVAQRKSDSVRVVLDLESGVQSANVFTAAPAGQHGHRLVIEYQNPVRSLDDIVAELADPARPVRVTIDPGHGGEDPGAIGPKGTYEKDVVLSISKRLSKALSSHPGIQAMLTREDDIFIPLKTRRDIAINRHKADLFLSVHADAARRRSARGASVFALSHKGKDSHLGRMLAAQANKSDEIGGVAPGYNDPELKSLLYRLAMESNMTQSLQVGQKVLGRIGEHASLHKKSVDQAGFAVLKIPNIPSILVETGFISNPKEEKALRSSAHQKRLAQDIKRGVVDYFSRRPLPGTWFASQTGNGDSLAYTVARGDTLSTIAHRYSMPVRRLKEANRLRSDRIRVGQVLVIPNS